MNVEVLAALTTLQLGGVARRVVRPHSDADALAAVLAAQAAGEPLAVLGGGSNVVVADAGFPGTIVQPAIRGRTAEPRGDQVLVTVGAGESWDELVRWAVDRGLAGIECLAGIPGWVGGTPVQNVGAYGQEVAETLVSVRAIDRGDGTGTPCLVELDRPALGFAYRNSRLRLERGRFVVLAVTFALRPGGAATVRYPELRSALGLPPMPESAAAAAPGATTQTRAAAAGPSLAAVREVVLALRRSKSMLLEPGVADPNRRSVGSFFTNPVVTVGQAAAIEQRARALGVLADGAVVPSFPAEPDRLKIPAAWLIERAGFVRGQRRGAVGISSRHALALVHHGGGSTAELVAFAEEVQATVASRFGVRLLPEPVWLGPPRSEPALFRAAEAGSA